MNLKRILFVLAILFLARSSFAQTVSGDQFILNTGPCQESSGIGSPEGSFTGVVCDTYHQTNTPYDIWRKTSGSGNTGWVKDTTGLALGVALTKVDDTNVTATLGGDPTHALLNAASITLGWTGTLAATRGGTGQSVYAVGDVLYAPTTTTIGKLVDVAVGSVLASGGLNTAPVYTTHPSLTGITGAGNLTLDPASSVILGPSSGLVLPNLNYTQNLGQLSNKYLTLHAAELWVETLVAQHTIATIGGRILVAPTNILCNGVGTGAAAFIMKYNNFNVGDRVYMEADGKVEFLAVTADVGTQTCEDGVTVGENYTMTRNLDGSGANVWYAGDAVLDTGTTGNGFIDLYSLTGILSGAGPTIVGNVRTGTAYNAIAPRWAIGNLNGLYGYGADTYGAVFGDASATNVTVDATNGFRVRSGTTNKFVADTSGNLSLVGDLTVGTAGSFRSGATAYGTGTGIWMDYNAGTPRARFGVVAGNKIDWDGTNLAITSASLTVNQNGVYIIPTAAGDHGPIAPGTSGPLVPPSYDGTNAYAFTATTGLLGTYANDNGTTGRTAQLASSWTGSSQLRSTVALYANGANNSNFFSALVLDSPGTSGTSSATLASKTITLTGDAGSSTTAATINGTLGVTGLLTVNAIGTHTITGGANSAQVLQMTNTTSGTAGEVGIYHTAGTVNTYLETFSQGYTGALASSTRLYADSSGGLKLVAAHGSGEIYFATGGATSIQRIDANGDLRPTTDSTQHVGVPSARYAYMTALAFNFTDASLDNGWSLTESERVGIAEPGVALVDDTGELIAFFGKSGFKAKGLPGAADVDMLPYAKTTLAQRTHMDPHPELRIKGYQQVRVPECKPDPSATGVTKTCTIEGPAIYKTAADVEPMPNPKDTKAVQSTYMRNGGK